jgi:hypothetical protein
VVQAALLGLELMLKLEKNESAGVSTGVKMNYYRRLAITTGALFIIYTGLDILSFLFTGSLTAPNYLVSVTENAGLVGTGGLLLFIGGACASGIAISLYPVLKKFNAGLALGAVGFRISEGVLRFVTVCSMLLMITLSQQFVQSGAPDSSYYQTLGTLLHSGHQWVGTLGYLVFSLGALLYYIIFYRTKLVPRWISIWGIVAAISGMLACALVIVGFIPLMGTVQTVLELPMLPQEMVFAVWLIVKGFNPSVLASESK